MEKNNKKFGNILFPLILIVAGVIFLLQNLGLLTGSAWDMLFSLWPLLIILLGINDLIRNRGIVGPTLSIGFGLIFLLSNLDILNWGAWMTILRLWPILVIALGLEIFIGRKNIWLSIVGVGFTLILLVGGLWYSGGILSVEGVVETPAGIQVTSEEIEQELDDAKSAYVNIESSVGELVIDSLSDDDLFIEGNIYTVEQETITENYKLSGDKITYYLSSEWNSGKNVNFADFNNQERLSWELSLTEEIPLFLDLSLSVGESDLDLSNLQISEFSLDMGVGQTTLILPNGQYQAQINGGVGQTIVHLPDEGEIELNVDGGVGEIRIYIPEDMPAKIYVDRGIAGLSIPSSYDKDEDVYTSPRFNKNKDHIKIYISQGIGSIVVREE